HLYSPRLLILACGLQLFALAAIAVLGLPLGPPYHPFAVNVADEPFRVVQPLTLLALGGLATAAAWRFATRTRPVGPNLDTDDARSDRRLFLVLSALIHLAYWPATLPASGIVGYVIRIGAAALVGAPFLAGRDSYRDGALARIWWATVLVNVAVGIMAGTRSRAFIPVVLFAAGLISAMPRRKRIIAVVAATIAAVPLIQIAGALGVVRDQLGRDALGEMRRDEATEVFRRLRLVLTSSNGRDSEETQVQGVSRLLAWTNVVVPLLTPEQVPYRQIDGILDEATSTFKIASLSGLTADDFYDAQLFNAPARNYGFHVSSDTSVEFTVAADGWSRGGAPVVLGFSLVLTLALVAMERVVGSTNLFRRGVCAVLILPVVKIAFLDANGFPLIVTLRSLFLQTATVWAIVLIATLVKHPLGSTVQKMRWAA